jgi:hypothetical protein
MSQNNSDYLATAAARNEPEILDQDMTRDDIVEVLAYLKFERDATCTIQIDPGLRDYLLGALRRKA